MSLFISIQSSSACSTNDLPVSVSQPNDRVLNLYWAGDAYYHWLHDEERYTVVMNENGYYVYADVKNGRVEATAFVVGEISGHATGLKPGLNLPMSEINLIRMLKGAYETDQVLDADSNVQKKRDRKPEITSLDPIIVLVRFQGESEFSFQLEKDVFSTSTNSIGHYFRNNDSQKANIHFLKVGNRGSKILAYQDAHVRGYFQPKSSVNPMGYDAENKERREAQLWKDALKSLQHKIPASATIDRNHDGRVDGIYAIVSGSSDPVGDILIPHRTKLLEPGFTIHGAEPHKLLCLMNGSLSRESFVHETAHFLGAPHCVATKHRTTLVQPSVQRPFESRADLHSNVEKLLYFNVANASTSGSVSDEKRARAQSVDRRKDGSASSEKSYAGTVNKQGLASTSKGKKKLEVSNIMKNIQLEVSSDQQLDDLGVEAFDIVLFPNPTESQIQLQVNNAHTNQCVLEIFSLSGEKIKTIQVNEVDWNSEHLVDLSDFKKGTYTMRVSAGEKAMSKMFIIK